MAGSTRVASRRAASTRATAAIRLIVLSVGVLALNWKYVYNFAAGPFPFDPDDVRDASHPVVQEFVRVAGPVVPIGWKDEITVRLLRELVDANDLSAKFLAARVGGGTLIVKVPVGFSGESVEGRLVPVPAAVRRSLGGATYPWMIDARTRYRWDFNALVALSAPLLVVGILLFGVQKLAGRSAPITARRAPSHRVRLSRATRRSVS